MHFTDNVTTCPFKSIHACKWGHRVEIKALSVHCLGGKWYTLCRRHIQYIFNTYFALFFKLKLCFFLRTQLTIRHNCLGQSPATTNKPWPLPMMTQFTHICICITKPRWFHRTENVMAKMPWTRLLLQWRYYVCIRHAAKYFFIWSNNSNLVVQYQRNGIDETELPLCAFHDCVPITESHA